MDAHNQPAQTPILETSDFRMYAPITATNAQSEEILMQLCESYDPESGRWEPFYTTRKAPQKNLQAR